MAQALPLLAAVPSGTTVFLVNFPYTLDFGDEPDGLPQPETVILLEHSVQGWADLDWSDKQLDVVGLTYLQLGAAGPEGVSTRVAFEGEDRMLEVQVGRGALVSLFPWSNAYGRHDYRRIFRAALLPAASGQQAGRGIRLRLAERYMRRQSVFLIYTATGVTLRTSTSFALEYCRRANRPRGAVRQRERAADL